MTYDADAPITPEQQTAMAAHAQKLNEMTGGASGKAAAEKLVAAAPAPKSENQKAIEKLNAPDSDLWSKDEVKQKAAYAKLREHLAAGATAEEKQEIADRPIGLLRDQYGLDHNQVLPSIRDRWDEHEEGTMLATLVQQGVSPEATKAIYGWYTSLVNQAVGDARNLDVAAVEGEFRTLAKQHGIADDVADALVEHHKGRLA